MTKSSSSRFYVIALDQGTTGSRAFVFDDRGRVRASAYQTFRQYYPRPGWVEHDAEEIWRGCCTVIRSALRRAKVPARSIAALGITNQRETTVLWDRKTGRPVSRAIVWQCRRTASLCRHPALKKREPWIHNKTGLVLDPYFSGTKIQWLLQNHPRLKRRARQGRLCFGTMDSWLVWCLTGGKVHRTDMTNASRTLLFDIHRRQWDASLLSVFDVPAALLPEALPSGSEFGRVAVNGTGLPTGLPIWAVLGDQQAALYGQGCWRPGEAKNTYGTGCFLVVNTGERAVISRKGLLTTLACDFHGRPVYALEGAVFIAGAVVQWLRDELGLIQSSEETERWARSVPDTQGVFCVPAFTGLGAPYWDSQARGILTGLTRGSNRAHIVRAALESIAYQTRDVAELMKKEGGCSLKALKVDGGACANNFLMQFQADILNSRIIRPRCVDTTVWGAALCAGVQAGVWRSSRDVKALMKEDKVFRPSMSLSHRRSLIRGWQEAVKQARWHD